MREIFTRISVSCFMKHHAKFDKNWISNEADISKNTKYKFLLQESPLCTKQNLPRLGCYSNPGLKSIIPRLLV